MSTSWIDPVTTWTASRIPETEDLNRIENNENYLKDHVDALEGTGSAQGVGTGDDVAFNSVAAVGTVSGATGAFTAVSAGSITTIAISGTTATFSEDLAARDGDFAGDVSGGNGTFSGALSGTSLNTGHGANELYAMDQNVTTGSDVEFNTLKLGGLLRLHGGLSAPTLFSGLSSIVPNTGDICTVTGGLTPPNVSLSPMTISYIVRFDSTRIDIYGLTVEGAATYYTILTSHVNTWVVSLSEIARVA